MSSITKNIFLTGPRGSGKTSVGRLAAESLGLEFVDADRLFVETHRQEIAALVEKEGWEAFRKRESEILESVCKHPVPRLVATGGGIVLSEANRRLMRESGLVFYLKAPAEILAARLMKEPLAGQRPSLTGKSPAEEMAMVLAQREELYRGTAHYIVNGAASPAEAAREIAALLAE